MTAQRVFARFQAKPASGLAGYGGRPDGAAVDLEGCYWVAMYEGGRVLRLSPSGETIAEVRMPARCPTMPCFGDVDLKTIYVTSASRERPADELRGVSAPGLHLRVPRRHPRRGGGAGSAGLINQGARGAKRRVAPIAITVNVSSPRPALRAARASARGGSSRDSSVSSNVPQWMPIERSATRSRWICTASLGSMCCEA